MSQKVPQHKYVSKYNNETREERNERLKNDFFYQEIINILPHVAEEVYHPKNSFEEINYFYNVPNTHGIDNSEQIIPKYYITDKTSNREELLNFDFYFTIIDSIRNMRILSKYQMLYIEKLDNEKCKEIIQEFNKAMEVITEYVLLDNEDS
jgi:hypothetical protein